MAERRARDLGSRIRLMLAARMLVVFAVGALVSRADARSPHVYVFLVAGLGLSAAYAVWLRAGRQLRTLVWLQTVLDQLLFTFVVYLTGGPASGATSLYGLTCLAAAILLGPRAAVLAAAVGLGSYVLLSLGMSVESMLHTGAELQLSPMLLNGGGVLAVAALASYLATRLAQTGGALERAEARAAMAERLALLGRVAAGLAHEIRNPLSSISASVEMLRESPGLGDDDRMLCEIVEREVARLNELVSDMMDLTRPRRPEPRPTDVSHVIRDVVHLAERLGRAADDVKVEARGIDVSHHGLFDTSQLRQVLWNLVKNAVEASAPGDSVRVCVERRDEQLEVRVEDDGQGMTESERGQVFDAFFTTRTKGTGLGLAVVRRIVDDHAQVGASLDVRSEKHAGTTFVLRFPAAEREPSSLPRLPVERS